MATTMPTAPCPAGLITSVTLLLAPRWDLIGPVQGHPEQALGLAQMALAGAAAQEEAPSLE